MKTKEKLSFREWCGNIWYYYKWLIILGGIVVLFLIIAFVQMLTSNEPDVTLLYTGKSTVTVKGSEELKNTVDGMIEDYNKDGTKTIDFLELTAHSAETSGVVFNADTNATVLRRFQSEIASGDSVIYLMEQYYYNKLLELDILAKLSDVLYEKDIPEQAIDEYGVYIKDLEIYNAPGFNMFPPDTILCIRRSPEKDDIKYGRSVEVYTANKLCFQKIINYKS